MDTLVFGVPYFNTFFLKQFILFLPGYLKAQYRTEAALSAV